MSFHHHEVPWFGGDQDDDRHETVIVAEVSAHASDDDVFGDDVPTTVVYVVNGQTTNPTPADLLEMGHVVTDRGYYAIGQWDYSAIWLGCCVEEVIDAVLAGPESFSALLSDCSVRVDVPTVHVTADDLVWECGVRKSNHYMRSADVPTGKALNPGLFVAGNGLVLTDDGWQSVD